VVVSVVVSEAVVDADVDVDVDVASVALSSVLALVSVVVVAVVGVVAVALSVAPVALSSPPLHELVVRSSVAAPSAIRIVVLCVLAISTPFPYAGARSAGQPTDPFYGTAGAAVAAKCGANLSYGRVGGAHPRTRAAPRPISAQGALT
jgi:hypothetical protein